MGIWYIYIYIYRLFLIHIYRTLNKFYRQTAYPSVYWLGCLSLEYFPPTCIPSTPSPTRRHTLFFLPGSRFLFFHLLILALLHDSLLSLYTKENRVFAHRYQGGCRRQQLVAMEAVTIDRHSNVLIHFDILYIPSSCIWQQQNGVQRLPSSNNFSLFSVSHSLLFSISLSFFLSLSLSCFYSRSFSFSLSLSLLFLSLYLVFTFPLFYTPSLSL